MTPIEAASHIKAEVDRLGRPMSLSAYREFLEELVSDLEIMLEATNSDEEE